ncbi:MAG TPA: DOMON-like domain-containing protein, partial [Steroidobacteraceae bacterium]|nr:DOMON-like domain-containing protein [Steroidobacteraceae bacterium]
AAAAQRAALISHPDTPGEAVWRIAAEVSFVAGLSLSCHYSLYGELARVRVPGARAGRRADGLWQHTCFEMFVAADPDPGYLEFNFSPGLDWAAYRFAAYRERMTPANLTQAPGLSVHRTPDRLDLSATVHLAGLEAFSQAPRLRVALAAVVEEDSGRLSYWALQHAPGNPDFHHADSFALELSGA